MTADKEKRLLDIIGQNRKHDVPIDTIKPEMSLQDIGINSISFIKIVIKLENEFQFKFGEDDFSLKKFLTLNDLMNYIEKQDGSH